MSWTSAEAVPTSGKTGFLRIPLPWSEKSLYLFQAIHQEADVVVENIDAIRAMIGSVKDPDTSIRMTNEALGFTAI